MTDSLGPGRSSFQLGSVLGWELICESTRRELDTEISVESEKHGTSRPPHESGSISEFTQLPHYGNASNLRSIKLFGRSYSIQALNPFAT